MGTWPITERWSAIARVGAQYTSARDSFRGTGAVGVLNPNPSRRETNLKLGLGMQYEINQSMLVRGEVERYRINGAVGNHGGVNVLSVSLVFPFGRSQTPVARAMDTPAYVAQAPLPAPAPQAPVVVVPAALVAAAPVVAAPERRRVTFSADSLFAFDRSDVRPEGKTALDAFTRELRGTDYNTITVEGYTDRLGSEAYNQKLSSQRAESVKSYLVNTDGVDAAKVAASGKGESSAVTKPGDCKGNRPSAQLIACLQPDRRVEVEVTGTR